MNKEEFEKEKERMKEEDPMNLIEYIKGSLEYFLQSKEEMSKLSTQKFEISESFREKSNSEYEQLIQNLEAEIRNHIRIEQQLKIHIDDIQSKLEEMEINENKYRNEIQVISLEL